MTTASLELCRELYELSGWENERWYWRKSTTGSWKVVKSILIPGSKRLTERLDDGSFIPAYDLGYLLRKLPYALEPVPGKYTSCSLVLYKRRTGWRVAYTRYSELSSSADTAEDAAAKLAIELFKQDILKPQGV